MTNKIAHFLPEPLQTSRYIYAYISELLDGQPGSTNTFLATGIAADLAGYFKERMVVKANESLYESELRAVKPLIIHAHGLGPGVAGLVYALGYKIPLVMSVYDDSSLRLLTDPPWPGYFTPLFQHCSKFIVSSNSLRDQLLAQGCPQKKILTIKIGVNLDRFQPPARRAATKTTGFLALLPVAGCPEMKLVIDAFDQLCGPSSRLQLTIISEKQPDVGLLSYIKKQNNNDKIALVRISDAEKYSQYLQSSDVFIGVGDFSSLNEQNRVWEALACGLPVIAVNSPELAEVVLDKRSGFRFAGDDKEALTQQMKELSVSKSLAAEMGASARRFIAGNHDLEKIRQELADCYQSLIKPKGKIHNFKREENYCQKILLIRSIPAIDFLYRLFFLKQVFPYSEIFVLTNPSTLALCQAHPLIDRVIEFSGHRFSPLQLKARQRRILSGRFDKVIVPFTNEQGAGFENVVAMAKLLGGRETLGLNHHQRIFKLGWLTILKPLANKKLFSRLVKKAVILIGVSLAILFLSVCYLLIKLVNRFKKPEEGNEGY